MNQSTVKLVKDKLDGLIGPPSVRDAVRADGHLHAVLPRIVDLVRLDPSAAKIAAKLDFSIEFNVVRGPKVVLDFAKGRVSASENGNGDLGLLFPNCATLNKMFDGEKVTPIPFRGFHLIPKMKHFEALTALLTTYLKPSPADMARADFRTRHVELSLLLGLAATSSIATFDPKGQRIMGDLHDGTILYRVKNGPSAHVVIAGGRIKALAGPIANPTTTIAIRDVELAVDLIRGAVDTFAANAGGSIEASGALALADEYNALFDRVGLYFS